MNRWILLQLELGNFQRRRTIYAFALKMSFLAVILSAIVIVTTLPLLDIIGLLPFPLMEAVQFGIILSWLVGGAVSGTLALLAGYAMHELAVSRAEFEQLSRTDMLSGLLNRRAFTQALEETEDEASLVIFDVDRFKRINDRYGHTCGDSVIVAVSRLLSAAFSGEHVVARLGGEEFGAIVRGGNVEQRLSRIEAARMQIAEHSISFAGDEIKLTVSAGVADIRHKRQGEAIYAAADKALYLAKALGRNRVIHEKSSFQYLWHQQNNPVPEELSDVDPRYGMGGI
jgi:diguanylate cyclase (GGDEF)-like protein